MTGTLGFGILGLEMGDNRVNLVTQINGAKLACVGDLGEDKAKQVVKELGCDGQPSTVR